MEWRSSGSKQGKKRLALFVRCPPPLPLPLPPSPTSVLGDFQATAANGGARFSERTPSFSQTPLLTVHTVFSPTVAVVAAVFQLGGGSRLLLSLRAEF